MFPCIARLLEGIAWCARTATPWCLTSVDEENAFNSASQASLAEAARELGRVAPELAACALRSQCAVRAGDGLENAQEMVVRGAYPRHCHRRFAVERFARGGSQGSPDMPVLFGMVMALVDEEATRRARRMSSRRRDPPALGRLPRGRSTPPIRAPA